MIKGEEARTYNMGGRNSTVDVAKEGAKYAA
jgi:hypothetical protein